MNKNLRQKLEELVPHSILSDVNCSMLHHHHPVDKSRIDLIVCTKRGEVFEFREKIVQRSILLEHFKPASIDSFRNNNGDLFYLISSVDQLVIVSSSSDNLEVVKHFKNVDKYSIDDLTFSGSAKIRVWVDNDIVPYILNDDFEFSFDIGKDEENQIDSSLITSLNVKLREAIYNLAESEKKYNELILLRQAFTHSVNQKMYSQVESAVDTTEKKVLAFTKNTPWLRVHAGNLVLGLNLKNCSHSYEITDIQIILSKTSQLPFRHKSCMLELIAKSPKWQIKNKNILEPLESCDLLLTIPLEDFSQSDDVEYMTVCLYKCDGELKSVGLEMVSINCLDVANEMYHSLNNLDDETKAVLSLMCTMHSTHLKVTQLNADLMNLPLCLEKKLNFKKLKTDDNTLIHCVSPYHTLHGMLIAVEGKCDNGYLINVLSRDICQLIFLVRCLYTSIPHRIIITTSDKIVNLKPDLPQAENVEELLQESMEIEEMEHLQDNIVEFGNNLRDQMSLVLEYFDECIVAMGKSRSSNLIGEKIDLSACGDEKYDQFCERMKCVTLRNCELLNG